MKNSLINKLLFAAFLAFAAANCSSTASNLAVDINTANTNSNALAAENPDTGDAAIAIAETAPDAIVTDLYKQHDANKSPFFQTKNRALVDKYFTKATADLIWKDAVDSKGEIGALDADPLYNAQDTEIKNFKVGQADINDNKAEVPVNFTNFGKKQKITFVLVKEKSTWKIEDIKYDDFTLVKLFKENSSPISDDKSNDSNGEFEGKYQVGDTTCTVKPIKMAFEVKWEKGKGSEIFLFQDRANDKYIFASDPNPGKANVFAFDDENYNSGMFYRADGKEFVVNRIK